MVIADLILGSVSRYVVAEISSQKAVQKHGVSLYLLLNLMIYRISTN